MLKFDHIAVSVSNLKKSIDFYQVLEFKLENIFHDEEYDWATMKGQNTTLELFCFRNAKNDYVSDLAKIGIHHFAFLVPSIDEAILIAKKLNQKNIRKKSDLMRKRELKNMEWGILITAIILCIIGIVALFSATQETEYEEFTKQIIWFVVSLIAMVIVMFIDYNLLLKASPVLYGIFIVLLIGVLFTSPINGATSWYNIFGFSFQPGEFDKVFVILFLTYTIIKIQRKGQDEINRITKLPIALAVVGVPILLIIMQPDYGTALAYIVAMALILFSAGLDKKYIIGTILLIVVAVPLLYNFVLPEHAKTRIDVFLNPESDPRGAGYNIIQSKIAIGSGGLTGMGILKGNQTQLGFLYPKTTDFIYSVIGEEMGFIVAGGIILLYVYLITKCIYIAKTAKDKAGSLIAIGITGIFLFHVLENIGMVMGLLPITGVPLPFISYGGSSLITNFICIGLLLNISGKRQKTIFVQ